MMKIEEAKRIVELEQRRKDRESNDRVNKWIESKIGSTWVYKNNCYSASSEKWNVYMKVIDRVDNCTALVETWEIIDPVKRLLEIHRERRYVYHKEDFFGYVECSNEEFMKNKNKILKSLGLANEDAQRSRS